MLTLQMVQEMVEKGIPGSRAEVSDMTGSGDHLEITVVAEAFRNKGPIERHRMVYSALGKTVGVEIHAVSLKTKTPDEA